MQEQGTKNATKIETAAQRKARLAIELRENLKKRKARGRKEAERPANTDIEGNEGERS